MYQSSYPRSNAASSRRASAFIAETHEKYPGPDGARNLLTDFEEKYGGRPTRASIDRTNAFIAETYEKYPGHEGARTLLGEFGEKYSGRPAREPSYSGNDFGVAADIQRRGRSRAPRPHGSSLCNEVHPGHEQYIRQYRDNKTAPVGTSIYGRLNPRDDRYPMENLALPDPALPHDGSRSEAKSRARIRVSTRIPSQPTLVPEDSISNDGRPFEQREPEARGRSKAPSHAQSRYGHDDYPSTVKPAPTTLSYREHEARARSRAPTITQSRYERQEHAPPTQPERSSRSVHPSTWFRRRQSSPADSIVHAHGRDQSDLNPTYTYKPAGQQTDSIPSVTHAHGNDQYDLNPTRIYQPEQPRQSVAPAARSSTSRRQSVAPDYRSSASRREPKAVAPRSSASRRQSVAPAYIPSTSRREPEAPASRPSASRRQSVAPDHRSSTPAASLRLFLLAPPLLAASPWRPSLVLQSAAASRCQLSKELATSTAPDRSTQPGVALPATPLSTRLVLFAAATTVSTSRTCMSVCGGCEPTALRPSDGIRL